MKKLAWSLLGTGAAFLAIYLVLIFFSRSPGLWMVVPLILSLLLNTAAVYLFLTIRAKRRQRDEA